MECDAIRFVFTFLHFEFQLTHSRGVRPPAPVIPRGLPEAISTHALTWSATDFEMPSTLEDDEIEAILAKADALVSWTGDVKEYALQQAVSGKQWKDWKIVEGRSNRKYVNETAVADTVKNAGYDPFEHKVLGITAITKLLGKTKFEELLSGFIEKPQGKPTLVPMSDKRPAMNTAANDFKEDN